jgi:hypothetical protein
MSAQQNDRKAVSYPTCKEPVALKDESFKPVPWYWSFANIAGKAYLI